MEAATFETLVSTYQITRYETKNTIFRTLGAVDALGLYDLLH